MEKHFKNVKFMGVKQEDVQVVLYVNGKITHKWISCGNKDEVKKFIPQLEKGIMSSVLWK